MSTDNGPKFELLSSSWAPSERQEELAYSISDMGGAFGLGVAAGWADFGLMFSVVFAYLLVTLFSWAFWEPDRWTFAKNSVTHMFLPMIAGMLAHSGAPRAALFILIGVYVNFVHRSQRPEIDATEYQGPPI